MSASSHTRCEGLAPIGARAGVKPAPTIAAVSTSPKSSAHLLEFFPHLRFESLDFHKAASLFVERFRDSMACHRHLPVTAAVAAWLWRLSCRVSMGSFRE